MSTPIPNAVANTSMSQLVALYNKAATDLGRATINRFSDRTTGEKRVTAILAEVKAAGLADASGERPQSAPEVQTKSGDPAVRPAAEPASTGDVDPGRVEAVGETAEAKQARLKKASADAIKAKPTPAAPVEGASGGLPVASGDPAKDAQMPALRRSLKPLNLAPKPKVYARKAGTKQALLVDMLARPEGATFGELYDALAAGNKPWRGVTIRSGLAWDINHLAGYGVTSTAHTGEEFAEMGRWYEAERLGVKNKAHAGGPYILGDAYDPAIKLLVYRLTYPKGMTGPLPHTPRATGTAEQKAAARAAMNEALKKGGEL